VEEIVAFLQRFGACDSERAEREGWTQRGLPGEALRSLIARRIVAPRVLTSYPLRVVWELRRTAHTPEQRAAVERLRRQLRDFSHTLRI
jgi:hypothetical protein